MSDNATLAFTMLYEEYQNRLDQGMDKGCNAFDKSFFTKYHFTNDEIGSIINELADNNLIEKWILGAFALKVDE